MVIRRQIQYVFQNPYASLNPRRSIGDSIAAPLREFEPLTCTELRQRVASALDQVALPAATADSTPTNSLAVSVSVPQSQGR